MSARKLILASASPRRSELLNWAGAAFEVHPVDIDESPLRGETPSVHVRRLAASKAEAAAKLHPEDWILAADTIVVLDDAIMGKPENRPDAERMLRSLSGRTHRVMTAFCLHHHPVGRLALEHVVTEVGFRTLSDSDIRRYIDSGEVWDKAGAYAIQGVGGALVSRLNGSYTNVIGLPLAEVIEALAGLKI